MDIVNNGIIDLSYLEDKRVRQIYNCFRDDLLDNKIRHFRPTGIRLGNVIPGYKDTYVSKLDKVGYSYIELNNLLSKLIFAEPGGKVDLTESSVPKILKLSREGLFLVLSGKCIKTDGGDSIMRAGERIVPKCLLKDYTIIEKSIDSFMINVILERGDGTRDFDTNYDKVNMLKYKPLRTIYDLTDVFTVKSYTSGSGCIELYYKEEVNEDVLSIIIGDYMKERFEDVKVSAN